MWGLDFTIEEDHSDHNHTEHVFQCLDVLVIIIVRLTFLAAGLHRLIKL